MRQEPSVDRSIGVDPFHPASVAGEIDGGGDVVVGDLALRPGHQLADRVAHSLVVLRFEAGPRGRRCRRSCEPSGGQYVAERHRAAASMSATGDLTVRARIRRPWRGRRRGAGRGDEDAEMPLPRCGPAVTIRSRGSGAPRGRCLGPGAMRASGVPTATSLARATSSSSTTPFSKTSTSMSDLSVSTTATMSPRCDRSPGSTRHSTTVPSSMSAPSDGMQKLGHVSSEHAARRRRRCRHLGQGGLLEVRGVRASAPRRCTPARPGRRDRRRRPR